MAFVRLCKSRGGATVGVRARMRAHAPSAKRVVTRAMRGVVTRQLRLSALRPLIFLREEIAKNELRKDELRKEMMNGK